MGEVKSYVVVIRNRDNSPIVATGKRELRSSRCSTLRMAGDLMSALLDDHPHQFGKIVPSKQEPEITPDGPVR